MTQKHVSIQKKKEKKILRLNYGEKYLEALDADVYVIEDRDKVFECATYMMNPNVWYVLGADAKSREMFGKYLISHHLGLEDLFLKARTTNPPDFFGQDWMLKALLLKKFHNNFDYGIFDVEGGKIKIRRMLNKEAVHKLEKILEDMHKVAGGSNLKHLYRMETKASLLRQKLEELTQEKVELENVSLVDPEYFKAQCMLKELQKVLLYSPLWLQ